MLPRRAGFDLTCCSLGSRSFQTVRTVLRANLGPPYQWNPIVQPIGDGLCPRVWMFAVGGLFCRRHGKSVDVPCPVQAVIVSSQSPSESPPACQPDAQSMIANLLVLVPLSLLLFIGVRVPSTTRGCDHATERREDGVDRVVVQMDAESAGHRDGDFGSPGR